MVSHVILLPRQYGIIGGRDGEGKLSVSFDAELADAIRDAAAEEGVSVSTWLASAAAAKARRRCLRAALDELAEDAGALSDEDIDRLIAEARERSIVTNPRRWAV